MDSIEIRQTWGVGTMYKAVRNIKIYIKSLKVVTVSIIAELGMSTLNAVREDAF